MADIKSITDEHIWYEQAGQKEKGNYTYWRGENARFYPNDASIETDGFLGEYVANGLMPDKPFIAPDTSVVAFGSCFAAHISKYLSRLRFNVSTGSGKAYVSQFGDGIVNTYAIRQQFEWAWLGRQPAVALWYDYDRRALGYDEAVRSETKSMLDAADVFVITLGLSEIWYDQPTGEVFWRAVPRQYFDPARHKFRMATFRENLANLAAIHEIIRAHRSEAAIVFTLSPIPLTATFRPVPCMVADSASKGILRAALDELLTSVRDPRLFYFPSYEIVTRLFAAPYMEDRRHVHKHILDFNMKLFERYYCTTGLADRDVIEGFRTTRLQDRKVLDGGHWAVPRAYLAHHKSAAAERDVEPRN